MQSDQLMTPPEPKKRKIGFEVRRAGRDMGYPGVRELVRFAAC